MNIGQRLRELRENKNFSQGDIEKRTGLLRAYVSRVENGHTVPNLDTLAKWATALEVELYQFFFEGQGKPRAAKTKETENLRPPERSLVDDFRNLEAKDKKFVVDMIRKMGKARRSAGRSTAQA